MPLSAGTEKCPARNSVVIAKEIGVSKHLLEDFVAGQRTPPPKVLQDLAGYIFGGAATYDATIDRLMSTNVAEPTMLGVKPPQFVPPKVVPAASLQASTPGGRRRGIRTRSAVSRAARPLRRWPGRPKPFSAEAAAD